MAEFQEGESQETKCHVQVLIKALLVWCPNCGYLSTKVMLWPSIELMWEDAMIEDKLWRCGSSGATRVPTR